MTKKELKRIVRKLRNELKQAEEDIEVLEADNQQLEYKIEALEEQFVWL